jgi:hypothetical protein
MAKGKRQKDKQYNGQRKMTKGLSFYRFPLTIILFVVCHFPLTILLFVLLSFSFDHYIVCPFVISL